ADTIIMAANTAPDATTLLAQSSTSAPTVPLEISPELKDFMSRVAWLLAAAWVVVILARFATPSGRSGMGMTSRLGFWHFLGAALFIYILMDLDRLPEFVNLVMRLASYIGDMFSGLVES